MQGNVYYLVIHENYFTNVFFLSRAVSLLDTMKKLESVTKKLQDPKITMSDVRMLFDFVIEKFPEMSYYLSSNAEIIQNPVLERAIVKIQDNQPLTAEEIACAQCFELSSTTSTVEAGTDEESESFAELALKKRRVTPTSVLSYHGTRASDGRRGRRRECVQVQPQYQPLDYIPPTSNICERFFSLAKLVYSDLRKAMKRTTLEMLLFLRLNRHLWDLEMVVQVVREHASLDEDLDSDCDSDSDEF